MHLRRPALSRKNVISSSPTRWSFHTDMTRPVAAQGNGENPLNVSQEEHLVLWRRNGVHPARLP